MQTKWNLALLLPNEDEETLKKMQKKIKMKKDEFVKKWKNNNSYLSDPAKLTEALHDYENWSREYAGGGAMGYYFHLKSTLDENDPNIKAQDALITEFAKEIANEMMFFTHRLAQVDTKTQQEFLTYPQLAEYKHFLEKLFAEARYLLSEKEEQILLLKSDPAYGNWTRMTSGFLSKEEGEVLNQKGESEIKNFSEIMSLMDSQDKQVRDSAAKAFNSIMTKYAEVAENELNSILQNKKIDDMLRKINRPDLTRHIADDIDSTVVDTLLTTVEKMNSVSHRYYALKAKLMGVPKLAYHERNVPYGAVESEYPFEDSVELVFNVFTKLDPEFATIFQGFLNNGQIDVFPKKGKRSGAFCSGFLISHPTYILLNHTDKLKDVLTLAHELGHGINNELIKQKQNAINYDTPTSTAEVASTFMEDFVFEELLSKANEKEQLSLLMSKLNDEISTVFRQVACYRFEQSLHKALREKGYLSKEHIGELFQKAMISYMGDAVEQSEGSQNWWVYWSHIRYFFYVYSYASGLLISKSLQNQVKKNPSFIQNVKGFLSTGTALSPKDIFAKLDIDITSESFWMQGIEEIDQLLKKTEELARKITSNQS